jgi:hypothetical protein
VTLSGQWRRKILGISVEEASVTRRGFHTRDARAAERLERIGAEFLGGYHMAVEEPDAAPLAARLNATVASEYRGFAFEGAAMALFLLDCLGLSSRASYRFVAGPGEPHAYMLHVGTGWAVARLPWLRLRPLAVLERFDPLLRWLVLDGWGFHEGYFHWPAAVRRHALPRGLKGYAARAFDQGLGRSLWFVEGTDPERIASAIAGFPAQRHGDLWAGVGLACAYAGGADAADLERLPALAGVHASAVAQGAAFAAEARRRAGNPVAHCDFACRALCGIPADDAAAIARETRTDLAPDGPSPTYEVWRARIRQHFVRAPQGVQP